MTFISILFCICIDIRLDLNLCIVKFFSSLRIVKFIFWGSTWFFFYLLELIEFLKITSLIKIIFRKKSRDKKLYRHAKVIDRKARNLNQVKCVEDEEDKILMEETFIKAKMIIILLRTFKQRIGQRYCVEETKRVISRLLSREEWLIPMIFR